VAILTKEGNIVTGFNIEHASYSLTICAERVTLSSLLAQGYKPSDIDKILVVADVSTPISPCGACREFMSGFIDNNVDIILVGQENTMIKTSIDELLPHRFTKQFAEK
jgi:cytidine deaminase